MLEKLWLIPILPLLGMASNGLLGLFMVRVYGRRPDKPFVSTVAVVSVGLAFLLSAGAAYELFVLRGEQVYKQTLFTWIDGGLFRTWAGELTELRVAWGLMLDPLSAVMILVVTGVGSLIHLYSIGYMWEEDGYYRYFAYLNLFVFFMLTLVLADNYLLMFVGWEGVGLCSYLLIGYWFARKSAADAGKKAFIVNRVGDAGFIVGMLLILALFGTLDFTRVFARASALEPEVGLGLLTAATLLLFLGATGKSAQIPLYTWLPDAMEGPTPVSALIHAATMVTAGVYMVARSAPLYTRTPISLEAVAIIGAATALFAASMGLVQRDIKRILAYSTVSQLGYMFAALGVGAFAAGIFHLMTHAFFKALLFLGAGSVIHAAHEQDILRIGGLKKYLPTTYWTMLIAALAIAGLPPLAGFFSKDAILWGAYSGNKAIWLALMLAAIFTAFYMFRLIFLTFHGGERFDEHTRHHLHEPPPSMTMPLVILALLSAVGGFVGVPAFLGHIMHVGNYFEDFLAPVFGGHGSGEATAHLSEEAVVTLLALTAAVAGIYIAYQVYVARRGLSDRLSATFGPIYRTLYNKYYVDEMYDALFVNRTKNLGNGLWAFDRHVIDGLGVEGWARATLATSFGSVVFDNRVVDAVVNLVGRVVQAFSLVFRSFQTGLVQRYALVIVLGLLIFASAYLYLR